MLLGLASLRPWGQWASQLGFRLLEPPKLPAQTCMKKSTNTTPSRQCCDSGYIQRVRLSPSAKFSLPPPHYLPNPISPSERAEDSPPHPKAQWLWLHDGLYHISLVQGLTGPSPPPSPSSAPRRFCPGGRRQGPGPQGLLHPGVPGLVPPRPWLLSTLSSLRTSLLENLPGSAGGPGLRQTGA